MPTINPAHIGTKQHAKLFWCWRFTKVCTPFVQIVNEFSCLDNPPEIEVDGGINLLNATKVLDAGADVIVAGSSIFKGDLKENLDAFMNICRSV